MIMWNPQKIMLRLKFCEYNIGSVFDIFISVWNKIPNQREDIFMCIEQIQSAFL